MMSRARVVLEISIPCFRHAQTWRRGSWGGRRGFRIRIRQATSVQPLRREVDRIQQVRFERSWLRFRGPRSTNRNRGRIHAYNVTMER